MPRCVDCQHYKNLLSKSTGGGVEFTAEEFRSWRRDSPLRRRCVFCGVDGEQLYALNILNPRTKKRYEVIGVDRKDNQLPYRLDNIQPCCPLCNGIKSGVLSDAEMLRLGPILREFWDARLAAVAASPGS
jgi:5-methylcytosine-specific restriction endonuclease McrA